MLEPDGPKRRFKAVYHPPLSTSLGPVTGDYYPEHDRDFEQKWGVEPNRYFLDRPFCNLVSRKSLKNLVWLEETEI